MSASLDKLTLENIGGGVVPELFQRELDAIVRNMTDINTISKKKRELIVKITLTPNAERDAAQVTIDCQSKLATVKPVETLAIMAAGGMYAAPTQRDIFADNVKPIVKGN